jgi:hypothetical protein
LQPHRANPPPQRKELPPLSTRTSAEMGVFILSETSAGYALFKAKDKKLLKGGEDLSTAEDAVGALKLKKFTVRGPPLPRPRRSLSCAEIRECRDCP